MTGVSRPGLRSAAFVTDPRFLVLFGFLIRLCVALTSQQFYHPDEVFQYLEQPHRLVFGYGQIPWEFRFGTRSWFLPGVVAGVLALCKGLGLDDPAVYGAVVKGFSCALSASLIGSAYVIGRAGGGEAAGRLAAVLACTWYELLYFAGRPTPETWAAYLIVGALALITARPTRPRAALFGFLCATAAVFRLQYVPAVAALMILGWFRWKSAAFRWALPAAGAVVLLAGYVDYLTWGRFFASFYNIYLFNLVLDIPSTFGMQPAGRLLATLAIASGGLFAVAGLLGLARYRKTWPLLLLVAAIVLPHSLIEHKEHRFVFAAIPLLLIVLAIATGEIAGLVRRSAGRRLLPLAAAGVTFGLSLLGIMGRLPLEKSIYEKLPLARDDIVAAYLYLNKEPDLAALMVVPVVWQQTGGYYTLHRNVPIHYPWLVSIDESEWRWYVSHVISAPDRLPYPGFTTVATFGGLEIRKQTNPPPEYRPIDRDPTYLFHFGIDEKIRPAVTPRP